MPKYISASASNVVLSPPTSVGVVYTAPSGLEVVSDLRGYEIYFPVGWGLFQELSWEEMFVIHRQEHVPPKLIIQLGINLRSDEPGAA